MYCGYITTLKNVRQHPNADRMKLADCFGNTVCVGLNAADDDIVIYFPVDGQLSVEYCAKNDLVRRKDENGNNAGGYLDPEKRNIRAIKLRGEKSDGLTMPLESLAYTGVKMSDLTIGTQITVVNGHEICQKYIPRTNQRAPREGGNHKKTRTAGEKMPYFVEHIDTPQLRFCMSTFKPGDIISLTEKVHGTSSRNANTLCISYKKNIFDKIFHLPGKKKEEYKYVVGTRRTTVKNAEGGCYGSNQFRIDWGEKFKGKFHSGESIFGEIAGFTHDGNPVMGIANNKITNDEEFIKCFGETTTFSYGCSPTEGVKPQSRYFIYRMTYTSPEGYVIEYPWDLVCLRAEQMGFEMVPELDRFIYTTEEDFMNRIQRWMDIPSTIDPSHVIEGVVVRALNAPNLRVAKEKSFTFKLIEGIIKDAADAPDMEEAEETLIEI
jgi:hypothetical protein